MICLLQARTSSKRLPKKVLKKIFNKSILERVIFRIKKSKEVKKIIVTTSTSSSDDKIVSICKKNKISFYRSNLNNVFLRYFYTIKHYNIPNFVRITADSPLIDPGIIDKAVKIFKKKRIHIVTNTFRRSYPKGQSVEVIDSKLILNNLNLIKQTRNKKFKEHITSYFYKFNNKFQIYNFNLNENLQNINLSVDTKEDFKLIKKIIEKTNDRFTNMKILVRIQKKILEG
tara:strand:+ start:12814 stop:13500 length:687 start_codon:yes stop_codon:yes gene_type:complete